MARKTQFTLPFKPKTKERPRMTRRGRAYTPKATTDAEDAIAEWIDKNKKRTKPFRGPVSVTMRFHKDHIQVELRERTRTSKLRGDVDNYAKLVLDALQKSHLLADDKQVVRIDATKENYR